jgi:predicted P-loop ATPase
MACYPTHSSTQSKPRLRWILPTDRDMTPDEYPAVARMVASWIGIETMDNSTYDCSRLMFWPTISKDAPYDYHEQDGPTLCVDDVLHEYGEGDAWKDSSLWPSAEGEKEIRARSLKKAGDPTEKPGIVGLFCRTYDIYNAINTFLSDVYLPTTDPNRYTYAGGTTAAGAIVYQDGAFLYSNHATDPAGGQCLNSFDLVRVHKFGELDADVDAESVGVTKLPSYRAMCEFAADLPEIKEAKAEEGIARMEAEFLDLAQTAAEAEKEAANLNSDFTSAEKCADQPETPMEKCADDSWKHRLELNRKTGECEPTYENIRLILANDKYLKGRLCYDLFSERVCLRLPVPWRPHEKGIVCFEDDDAAGLRWYMGAQWHIEARQKIEDGLIIVARTHAFHPVREYLDSLTWDGIPRVETMLIDYMQAEDTPLNRAISKRWMTAACRRVYEPGVKFDTLLVLVSDKQGIGKSQFADVLGGKWFRDGLPPLNSKDAVQGLLGNWIIEVGEMAATKKADDELIKQFFACRSDKYRASYGHFDANHPRQCVFFGTTNSREFIMDNTGGRRFWPVEVHASAQDTVERITNLKAARDQLWAEARELCRQGEPIFFTEPEFVAELSSIQQQHAQTDEWVGMLEAFLDRPLPDDWCTLDMDERRQVMQGMSLRYKPEDEELWSGVRTEVTIAEIRNEWLGEKLTGGAGGNYPVSRHLGRIMNVLPGWRLTNKKTPRDFPFGRQKVYERIM